MRYLWVAKPAILVQTKTKAPDAVARNPDSGLMDVKAKEGGIKSHVSVCKEARGLKKSIKAQNRRKSCAGRK